MKDKPIKHIGASKPPYVGRGTRPAPQLTPRQLELIDNLQAIDDRSNRRWDTGRPQPVSNLAEQAKKRIYSQLYGYDNSHEQLDIPIP